MCVHVIDYFIACSFEVPQFNKMPYRSNHILEAEQKITHSVRCRHDNIFS